MNRHRKCLDECEAKIACLSGTTKRITGKSAETVLNQTLILFTNKPTQTENVGKDTINPSTQTTNNDNFEENAAELEKDIPNILQNKLIHRHTQSGKQHVSL